MGATPKPKKTLISKLKGTQALAQALHCILALLMLLVATSFMLVRCIRIAMVHGSFFDKHFGLGIKELWMNVPKHLLVYHPFGKPTYDSILDEPQPLE